MTTEFGGFLQNEDAENRAGLRRTKRMDAVPRQNAQNGGKRAALGNITNQARIQPSRAVKNQISTFGAAKENFGLNKENAAVTKNEKVFSNSTSGFTIHCDKSGEKAVKEDATKARPALQDLFCEEVIDITDSPMVVDESMTEVTEKSLAHATVSDRRQRSEDVILTVPEYSDDIYKYLREAEHKHLPKHNYMKKQPDITDNMRSILVDWLIEVAEEYKLHRETLFLSVNYIDRFLSQMSVLRGKLQLVGAACMFMASKYEEIYPPDVGEFVYITDDTYTKRQVLRMEHLVLKVLSFDIAVPTINVFTDWYLKKLDASDQLSHLTMFLTELSLIDGSVFMKYVPSVVSTAALCLANFTVNDHIWTPEIESITQYTLADVSECLSDLHKAYMVYNNLDNCPQKAAYEKYKAEEKYQAVSAIPCPPLLPLPMQ